MSSDFSITLDRIALVPEPGSLSLFADGMALLLATRRRRDSTLLKGGGPCI
jgi:hypothetical protein